MQVAGDRTAEADFALAALLGNGDHGGNLMDIEADIFIGGFHVLVSVFGGLGCCLSFDRNPAALPFAG